MIPNHIQFIEAITRTKVCLRFYSRADSDIIDLVCTPLEYGPGADARDGENRYWFWDFSSNTGSPTLGLLPEQVLNLRILGPVFDAADFNAPPLNVLPFPVSDAKASGAASRSAPLAQREQWLEIPATEIYEKPSRSHQSLWKNINTKTT